MSANFGVRGRLFWGYKRTQESSITVLQHLSRVSCWHSKSILQFLSLSTHFRNTLAEGGLIKGIKLIASMLNMGYFGSITMGSWSQAKEHKMWINVSVGFPPIHPLQRRTTMDQKINTKKFCLEIYKGWTGEDMGGVKERRRGVALWGTSDLGYLII